MEKKILITGASGLLGRELVGIFQEKGFEVLAHYAHHRPRRVPRVRWLRGDFRTLSGISRFLRRNRVSLQKTHYLVNNYGPITHRAVKDLRGRDILEDFSRNVLPAFEITRHLLEGEDLKVVVNILFEGAERIRAYRNILSYALAKHSLLIVTKSLSRAYRATRFENLFIPPLTGAKIPGPRGASRSPVEMAREVFRRTGET